MGVLFIDVLTAESGAGQGQMRASVTADAETAFRSITRTRACPVSGALVEGNDAISTDSTPRF
jgi:hypothetical protein